jgi:hypothetical protein
LLEVFTKIRQETDIRCPKKNHPVVAFVGYVRRNKCHNEVIFLAEIRICEGYVTGVVACV